MKQFLKVFDGDDAVKRGSFRLVSVIRATKNEEVVVRVLPLSYNSDYKLQNTFQNKSRSFYLL